MSPASDPSELFSDGLMLSFCVQRAWPRFAVAILIVALFLRDLRAVGLVAAVFVVMVGVDLRIYSKSRAKHTTLKRKFGTDYEAVLQEKLAEFGLTDLIWRRWVDIEIALEKRLGIRELYR